MWGSRIQYLLLLSFGISTVVLFSRARLLEQRIDFLEKSSENRHQMLLAEVHNLLNKQQPVLTASKTPTQPLVHTSSAKMPPSRPVAVVVPDPLDSDAYDCGAQTRFIDRLHTVHGITRALSHFLVPVVSRAQRRAGLVGPVGEWGVFKGKFTISLMLSASDKELRMGVFVSDLFGQRHGMNPAGGTGDRIAFNQQISEFTGPKGVKSLKIDTNPSVVVTVETVRAKISEPFRLISIDGDHSKDGALHDICVAAQLLAPGGVLVIDDLDNPDWPGVRQAWDAYWTDPPDACGDPNAPPLTEFAHIAGKLWVAKGALSARKYATEVEGLLKLPGVSKYGVVSQRAGFWKQAAETYPGLDITRQLDDLTIREETKQFISQGCRPS